MSGRSAVTTSASTGRGRGLTVTTLQDGHYVEVADGDGERLYRITYYSQTVDGRVYPDGYHGEYVVTTADSTLTLVHREPHHGPDTKTWAADRIHKWVMRRMFARHYDRLRAVRSDR